MGAGKTALGKRLAVRLGYSFCDTDHWIEVKEKTTVVDLFSQKGEPYFRTLETKCLQVLTKVSNHVIATGGGVLTTEGNMDLIRKIGTSIFINTQLEHIIERVMRNDKRPLVRSKNPVETITSLYHHRLPLYAQADINFIPEGTHLQSNISQLIRLL